MDAATKFCGPPPSHQWPTMKAPSTTPSPTRKMIRPRCAADMVRVRPAGELALDEACERAAVRALRQLLERLRLDLADALARHLILAADFFERVLASRADAEAQTQNIRLARGEARERLVGGGAQLCLRGGFRRHNRAIVGDEVADGGIAILAQRRIEAHGIAHQLEHGAHLGDGHA